MCWEGVLLQKDIVAEGEDGDQGKLLPLGGELLNKAHRGGHGALEILVEIWERRGGGGEAVRRVVCNNKRAKKGKPHRTWSEHTRTGPHPTAPGRHH